MTKRFLPVAMAASFALGLGALTTASAYDHRQEVIERYCVDNNRDGVCDDYRAHHDHWGDREYAAWYTAHRDNVRAWYAAHRQQEHWDHDQGDVDVIFNFHT
jgi:hypothetical protein